MGVIIFLLASALVIAVVFSFVYTFNLENRLTRLEKQTKQLDKQVNQKSNPIYFEEE